MSALEKTRLAPERSTPRASINASLISPPCAPAFMRKRPADRAGHAAQEREAVHARLCGGLGDERVRRGRPRDEAAVVQGLDCAERPAAEADDDAGDAAVAHDEVRAEADRRDRRLARQRRPENRRDRPRRPAKTGPGPGRRRETTWSRASGALAARRPRSRGARAFSSSTMSGNRMGSAPLQALSSAASSPGSA